MEKDVFIYKKLSEAESFYITQENIKNEWKNFIRTGDKSSLTSVRKEVRDSWERSYNMGIKPLDKPLEKKGYKLTSEQLSDRLEKNKIILDIISPLLELLVENLGPDFRIDYYDDELYLLKIFYSSANALTINPYMIPGVNRAEKYTGTNAPNLCSILKKPIQLTGAEHYLETSHLVTCAAAPICNSSGNIMGIINAYGPYERVQFHTLGMIITLAKAIEQTIIQYNLRLEKDVALQYTKHIMNSISDGVVALDSNGSIMMINSSAERILNLPSRSDSSSNLQQPFSSDSSIMATLHNGISMIDKELFFSHGKHRFHVFGNSLPITHSAECRGALAVFKEMSSAKKIINNLGGFRAYYNFDNLVGKDYNFTKLLSLAKNIAKLQSNVLIIGESGTGKELLAQSIHNASNYSSGPFVGINCAAIPGNLIESELFGYEGGAFTGGKREGQLGKFSLAENGTLFLDEIDSLSITNQATLLRVIQNRTFVRIGGTKELKFNARLIVASNKDLLKAVSNGEFRQDLYYRINVIVLSIPPLRERKNDIIELTKFFSSELAKRMSFDFYFSNDAINKFLLHQWPGNVRELENLIERCAISAYSQGKSCIDLDILNSCNLGVSDRSDIFEEDILDSIALKNSDQVSINSSLSNEVSRNKNYFEKQLIEKVLKETDYNLYQAAKKIGIARTTLYNKIKKYNVPILKSNKL